MSQKCEVSGLILDGYTRPGYIAKVPYLHPELRFRFRPMLALERDELLTASRRLSPQQFAASMAKAMANRIVEWNLTHDGQPVTISSDNIQRLQPNLFDRLFWIVSGANVVDGRNISDVDPQWDTSEADAESDAALDRAINGSNFREAKDAGN